MLKDKVLEILNAPNMIPDQDLELDNLIGLQSKNLESELDSQALLTSYFDFYEISKHLPQNTSFVDIGSGLSRSKLIYSIIREDIKTFAIEINKKNYSLAKESLDKNKLSSDGLINVDLMKIPLPVSDYYFIYLETGAVLSKVMEEIRSYSKNREINVIAIESHGDLINTLKRDHNWLKEISSELRTKIPRHDEKIYFFKSIKDYDHQKEEKSFRLALSTLVKNKILPIEDVPKEFRHTLIKKLSFSRDFEVIMRGKDIDSDDYYDWMGSTYNIRNTEDSNQYELSYPPRTIHTDDIKGFVVPEDLWWKYRYMRFNNMDFTTRGKIRKLIIKPKLMVEFTECGRKLMYKLERGYGRIMKKRKVLQKKFDKQKEKNEELTEFGPHEFIIVLDHLKADFNIGKIFRTAEAFGAREVHVIGSDFFDPTPSKGGFKKVKAFFYESFDESYKRLMELGYTPYCLHAHSDNYLHNIELKPKTAFILGHEEFGPQFDFNDFEKVETVKIKQFGKTESLNVSIAASLATYEYIRQIEL